MRPSADVCLDTGPSEESGWDGSLERRSSSRSRPRAAWNSTSATGGVVDAQREDGLGGEEDWRKGSRGFTRRKMRSVERIYGALF